MKGRHLFFEYMKDKEIFLGKIKYRQTKIYKYRSWILLIEIYFKNLFWNLKLRKENVKKGNYEK